MGPTTRATLDAAGRPPLAGQTVVPSALVVPAGEVVDPDALVHRALTVAEAQRTLSTRRTYRTAYRSLIEFLGEGVSASALTVEAVTAWRNALEAGGRAPRTIAVYLSAVRLLADELGADPLIRRVRSERVQPGQPRFLEADQLERLLKMPDRRTRIGKRDHAILLMAARAGLRRAELATIPFAAIQERRRLPDRRHRLAVSGSTTFAIHVRGKRGRERVVPLAAEILPALAAWRDVRPAADTDCLFTTLPNVKGRAPGPLDARDIGRTVERYARQAGLPDELLGAHVLRHTFATDLRGNGAALDVIRDLLGHEDIRTTQIYAHVDQGQLEDAVDAAATSRSAFDRL